MSELKRHPMTRKGNIREEYRISLMLLAALVLLVMTVLTGCATPEPPPPPPQPEPEPIAYVAPEPIVVVPEMLTIQIYYQARRLHEDARQAIDDYLSGIDYPEKLNFTVEGYTCTEGDSDYNMLLSEWRAQAVKDYMVEKGIDAGSITVIGHGVKDPVASNRTRAGRVKNRRVTISAAKAY